MLKLPKTTRMKLAIALLVFSLSYENAFCEDEFQQLYRDEGENVTLHCPFTQPSVNVNWIVSDVSRQNFGSHNNIVLNDGSLLLSNVSRSDSHIYTCQDAETNQSLGSIRLTIRGVPPAVSNLTVIAHSVYALVTWKLQEDGGYPITKFILKYRLDESLSNSTDNDWSSVGDIHANTTSVAVFHLMPNSTYYFRIQAVNRLGKGPHISVMEKTKYDPDEMKEADELLAIEQSQSSNFYMK